MDNLLTAAELKRRGMAAIEEGLKRGPVRIIKHNRPAAVVVSTREYERLLRPNKPVAGDLTALQWLLAHPAAAGELGKADIDRRVRAERNW